MLTIEDCIALSHLTPAEVDAIAEHEHLPDIVALEMGEYLMHLPTGEKAVKRIIRDDIHAAQARGDFAHSAKLKLVLKYWCEKQHKELRDEDLLGGGPRSGPDQPVRARNHSPNHPG
jgi:hypothetical protein